MSGNRPSSPFKGLNAFEDSELDALLFFGREREREIVAANLTASRLTVLYGPSGVGKSSLLCAAVARSLRQLREAPLVIVFSRWSDDPAAALADAVTKAAGTVPNGSALTALVDAQSDRDVYLILDQAEEYFLYHADDRGPESFAETLPAVLAGRYRINVLVSLREDSLANLDRFTGRISGLFENTLRLDRLDRPSARAAIVRPVERFAQLTGQNVGIEPELVERVLDEVGAGQIEPALGGLGSIEGAAGGTRVEAPYLQVVMQRLWDEERGADSDVLRVTTLDRLGGGRHIVEEHLEGAMAELNEAEKDVATRLFNHLVTPSGMKISHTVSDLAELGRVPPNELQPVLDRLSDRRILRSLEEAGGLRYEIFHDVLAQPVLAWRTRHRTEREIERKLADAHRRRRRLQRLFALVLVALGLMGAVTVYALSQRSEARRRAHAARLAAQKESVAAHEARVAKLQALARAEFETNPQRGVRLARNAARLAPTTQSEDLLRAALRASHLRSVVRVGEPIVAAWARRGDLVSVTASGALVKTTQRTGRSRRIDTGASTRAASFSADGSALLIGDDGHVRIVRPGRPVSVIGGLSHITGGALSADGKVAVVFNADGALRIDVESGRALQSFLRPNTLAATISPNGDLVAAAHGYHAVRVWDARTGERVLKVFGRFGRIVAVALSPHGDLVAAADSDGSAQVWRVVDGTQIAILTGHGIALTDVAFSPTGREILTASRDRTIRLWIVATNLGYAVLRGHTQPVTSARFADPGSTIVSASTDGTARLWNSGVAKLQPLANVGGPVTRVAYSRDGQEIRATTNDARVHILDRSNGTELGREPAPRRVRTVRGPNGAIAEFRGDTVVVRSRGQSKRLERLGARVTSANFSTDGRSLVTTAKGAPPRVWDLATGRAWKLVGHVGQVQDARFSPDGRWIVTAGTTAGIWNVRTRQRLMFVLGSRKRLTSAAFDPTGRTIVTGSLDGTVRTYRCDLCGDVNELLALANRRLAATEP